MASCGIDAMALTAEREFDVFVMDIKMPGMNGLELLRNIKEKRPNARVIMMSAVADPEMETESRAMQLQAFAFLRKPCKLQDLDDAIQRALAYQGPSCRAGAVWLEAL
ncbi:MAG: response regulator, partial [Dehalococcoidia bacterium]|nr:response regulator [Dehalococcoidia bacterium]